MRQTRLHMSYLYGNNINATMKTTTVHLNFVSIKVKAKPPCNYILKLMNKSIHSTTSLLVLKFLSFTFNLFQFLLSIFFQFTSQVILILHVTVIHSFSFISGLS